MRIRLVFIGCVLPVLLGACAPLQPFRTEPPAATVIANPTPCSIVDDSDAIASTGLVAPECASRIREDASRYSLYFAEFDDQGWTYPDSARYRKGLPISSSIAESAVEQGCQSSHGEEAANAMDR